MPDFPTIQEEDLRQFDSAMQELLARTGADFTLLIEKAGYRIHVAGDAGSCNTDKVAALAANSFAATEFLTGLLDEPDFTAMYQQGERVSTLMLKVDESCRLLIVFRAARSVGAIKYYARTTVQRLAEQLEVARQRAPGELVDLATLNPTDIGEVFQRRPERTGDDHLAAGP